MNQPQDLTDLITAGEVLAVDPDVTDAHDFAKGLESRLSRVKAHSALAVIATQRTRCLICTTAFRDHCDSSSPRWTIQLPQPAVLMQMHRNAQLRLAFLQGQESWDASQVATFAGSSAKNASATAGRWKRDGRIFAVDHDSGFLYPAFQFDPATRKPKPVIARLLSIFSSHDASSWEVALWLASPRPGFDEPPLRIMDSDPLRVIQAAEATYRPAL